MTTSTTGSASSLSNRPEPGYSSVSRLLHWLVAAGIVLQFMLGERAEEAAVNGDLPAQLAALAQHKSIGITVLGLALMRVIWRAVMPVQLPPLATTTSALLSQERLAKLMHIALYALLFFLPLSGWLMSSASGYSVSWFNLAQLPDLIGPSESAKELLQTLHNGAGKLLFVLAVGHLLAALKHWFIDKDGVMGRMGNPAGAVVFVATIAAGVAFTWPGDTTPANPSSRPDPDSPSLTQKSAVSVATPPAPEGSSAEGEPTSANPEPVNALPDQWNLHADDSYIRFTAQQAGADFTGEWERFTAAIRFDANDLANSSARVTIDATALETNDEERDEILAGLDWFDSENFGTVIFSADNFKPTSSGFSTPGTLTVRGASYPVTFDFAVDSEENFHTLTGTARLDRLELQLGTIDWLDTEWVSQFVHVEVRVQADTYPE